MGAFAPDPQKRVCQNSPLNCASPVDCDLSSSNTQQHTEVCDCAVQHRELNHFIALMPPKNTSDGAKDPDEVEEQPPKPSSSLVTEISGDLFDAPNGSGLIRKLCENT